MSLIQRIDWYRIIHIVNLGGWRINPTDWLDARKPHGVGFLEMGGSYKWVIFDWWAWKVELIGFQIRFSFIKLQVKKEEAHGRALLQSKGEWSCRLFDLETSWKNNSDFASKTRLIQSYVRLSFCWRLIVLNKMETRRGFVSLRQLQLSRIKLIGINMPSWECRASWMFR